MFTAELWLRCKEWVVQSAARRLAWVADMRIESFPMEVGTARTLRGWALKARQSNDLARQASTRPRPGRHRALVRAGRVGAEQPAPAGDPVSECGNKRGRGPGHRVRGDVQAQWMATGVA